MANNHRISEEASYKNTHAALNHKKGLHSFPSFFPSRANVINRLVFMQLEKGLSQRGPNHLEKCSGSHKH